MFIYLEEVINNLVCNCIIFVVEVIYQIVDSIYKCFMVMIFSDMFDQLSDIEQLFFVFQYLKYNKYEVVFFYVVDKVQEMDFDFENCFYLFVDMEMGEEVCLQFNQVKDYYIFQMKQFKEDLKFKCL